MKKIFVISLGCPKNLTDTEEMMGELSKAGYAITPYEEEAEAVLLNTCGFIAPAVEESEGEIERLLSLKKKGRIKTVVVAGCLVQRNLSSLSQKFPGVDSFVGIGSAQSIAEAFRRKGEYMGPVPSRLYAPEYKIPATVRHSAYIKIADGCNNRCSYCTIPSIRGPYRSKPIEDIIAEASAMAAGGVKELSLVAQDTTSYGCDIYGKPALLKLLPRLEKIKGLKWIRVMYAYPELISEDLMKFMAGSGKLCHYVDMPLQHISDHVLKAMNRRTGEKLIREKLDMMLRVVPDIAVRTNFIVGFPGETESDFRKLARFVGEGYFSGMGVFPYWREKGTPAFSMAGQVPSAVKRERADMLVSAQSVVVEKRNVGLLGRKVRVIVDCPDTGRTFADAPDIDGCVKITGGGRSVVAGEFATVKILACDGYKRYGVPQK